MIYWASCFHRSACPEKQQSKENMFIGQLIELAMFTNLFECMYAIHVPISIAHSFTSASFL